MPDPSRKPIRVRVLTLGGLGGGASGAVRGLFSAWSSCSPSWGSSPAAAPSASAPRGCATAAARASCWRWPRRTCAAWSGSGCPTSTRPSGSTRRRRLARCVAADAGISAAGASVVVAVFRARRRHGSGVGPNVPDAPGRKRCRATGPRRCGCPVSAGSACRARCGLRFHPKLSERRARSGRARQATRVVHQAPTLRPGSAPPPSAVRAGCIAPPSAHGGGGASGPGGPARRPRRDAGAGAGALPPAAGARPAARGP